MGNCTGFCGGKCYDKEHSGDEFKHETGGNTTGVTQIKMK